MGVLGWRGGVEGWGRWPLRGTDPHVFFIGPGGRAGKLTRPNLVHDGKISIAHFCQGIVPSQMTLAEGDSVMVAISKSRQGVR